MRTVLYLRGLAAGLTANRVLGEFSHRQQRSVLIRWRFPVTDIPLALKVSQVFTAADLTPRGPLAWGTLPDERGPGVYVVSLVTDPNACSNIPAVKDLPESDRQRWLHGQAVVYIERTRRQLHRRLTEFYRHTYGKGAPHRGGQAVKLLKHDLWVFWAPKEHPVEAELAMIEAFRNHTGSFPFANRRR